MQPFKKALLQTMKESEKNDHADNWDFGERPVERHFSHYPAWGKLSSRVSERAAKAKAFYKKEIRPLVREFGWMLFPKRRHAHAIRRFDDINFLYELLEDKYSKDLLVDLFAFRAIGHRKVRLPRNTPEHWAGPKDLERLETIGDPLQVQFMNLQLKQRDLRPLGYDLRAYCTPMGGALIFKQHQYELHRGDVTCKADLGDVVIEAGACWGETALYFAHEVGPTGKVAAFEFIPSNLEVLQKNIAANPHLVDRIELIDRPLWSSSDQPLYYVDWGPGSRVSFEKMRADFPDTQTTTVTIDDVAGKLKLPSVDFIKMDIEGAELNALKGAEQVIRKHHPKLAISLYHSIEDFKTVPRFIESLGLKYKYYLDHHTIYENETVLFAVPQR